MKRNKELEELLGSLSPKAIFYFGMAYVRAAHALEMTDNVFTKEFHNCRKELNRFVNFRVSIGGAVDTRSPYEKIKETLDAAHMYAVEAKDLTDKKQIQYDVEWNIREAIRLVEAMERNGLEGDDT